MLEDIYNKVYAGTEEIKSADYAISSQLTPLIENADLEGMTREEFVDLLCRAGAIGEKAGFALGARFLAKLICDALC